MKKYIVDIETKPQINLIDLFNKNIKAPKNIKDQEKIDAAIESKKNEAVKMMSVDTDFADIFCIGLKEVGGDISFPSLTQFAKLTYEPCIFITFNGRNFDLPIIIKQGLKNNVDMNYKGLYDMTQRYSKLHIDLMELIGEYGKYKKMDDYLQIYLGISKKEIDFNICSNEELLDHCREDLINTEKLYNLFKKLT